MQSLEQALKNAVETHGSTHPKCAALYNKLGNSYFREDNLAQAKECYQNAVCCDPCRSTASAYLNLGTIYWRTAEADRAMPMLKQALDCHEADLQAQGNHSLLKSPFAASVYHQMGLCHALQTDFDNALASLKKSLAIYQRLKASVEEGKILSAMGKVMTMKGDKQRAVAYHELSYRILASNQALSALYLSNLAKAYEAIGENSKALAMYKEMLTIIHERDTKTRTATEQKMKQLMDDGEKLHNSGTSALSSSAVS
jgi:tetratricopeptide (TPR) repeat protein